MTTRARVLVVGRGPHSVTVVHKIATWGNIAPENIYVHSAMMGSAFLFHTIPK